MNEQDSKKALAECIAQAYSDASGIDWQEIGRKVYDLLKLQYSSPAKEVWPTVISLTSTAVVYAIGEGTKYKATLTITDGQPTLSDPVEVEAVYLPIEGSFPVTESFEFNLSESNISKDGYEWDIQLIAEGQTLSANADLTPYAREYPSVRGKRGFKRYLAEGVREAVTSKRFEQLPFVLRGEDEHLGFQNGGRATLKTNEEISKIAGNVTRTYVAESGGKVTARGILSINRRASGESLRTFLLAELAKTGTIPIELSITAIAGKVRIANPEATNPILEVQSLAEVLTADPCIRGNAGGKFLGLAESFLRTTMNEKDKLNLAVKFGQAIAKNKNLAKVSEAAEEGAATQSIEQRIATAFLAANPAVAALHDGPDDFLKNPKAMDALNKWLDEILKAPATEEKPADTPPATDGGAVSESALEKRLKILESQVVKSEAQLAESHLEKSLAENKFLTEGSKNFLRNVVKNSGITQVNAIDSLIRDAQKNMAVSESFRNMYTATADERDKGLASLINLMLREGYASDGVKARVAESMGYNVMDKKYNGLRSIKEMLRIYDGFDINDTAAFGVGRDGKLSEAYEPAISSQLAFDAMHVVAQATWEEPEMYDDWRKIVRIVPVSDFRNIESQNFGYFKASDIAERTDDTADYQELAMKGAESAGYTLKDYGFLFGVSWKDFVNDAVQKFVRIPSESVNAFKRKIYTAIFIDVIWNSPFTTWVGKESNGTSMVSATTKIVDSAVGNAPTSGATLAFDKLQEAYLRMLTSKQLGADAAIGVRAEYLLHMVKDYGVATAATLPLGRGDASNLTDNGKSRLQLDGLVNLTSQAVPLKPIMVPEFDAQCDDSHSYDRWFLMANPRQQECINVYVYTGIQEPLLMQEAAGTGKHFTADMIRYKCKYPHAVGVVNRRGIDGNAKS